MKIPFAFWFYELFNNTSGSGPNRFKLPNTMTMPLWSSDGVNWNSFPAPGGNPTLDEPMIFALPATNTNLSTSNYCLLTRTSGGITDTLSLIFVSNAMVITGHWGSSISVGNINLTLYDSSNNQVATFNNLAMSY